MKGGNYGTGGKVHKVTQRTTHTPDKLKGKSGVAGRSGGRSSSGGAATGGPSLMFGFLVSLVLISIPLWIWCEWHERTEAGNLSEVAEAAVVLRRSQQSDEMFSDAEIYKGRLIHLQGVSPVLAEEMRDNEFGIDFPGAAMVERKTQYCQWREIEHRRSSSHKEQGYCTKIDGSGPCIYEGCGYGGRDQCNSVGCCSWVEGADVKETEYSYSYRLDWRSRIINSRFFQHPLSYDNPQRDPVPSYSRRAFRATIGPFKTDASKLPLGTTNRYTFLPELANSIGNSPAGMHGFLHVYPDYVYSDYRYYGDGGWASYVAATAGKYYLEGVVDTGIPGKCTPGDLRTQFRTAPLASSVSIVAFLDNDGVLRDYTTSTGSSIYYSVPGNQNLDDILNARSSYAAKWTWSSRIFVLLSLAGLSYIMFAGEKEKAVQKAT